VNRSDDRIDVLRVLHDAMDVPRHWPERPLTVIPEHERLPPIVGAGAPPISPKPTMRRRRGQQFCWHSIVSFLVVVVLETLLRVDG